MTRAVLFDYGLTLVTFSFPRRELLAALEEVRPWLGAEAPEATTLLHNVLEPLDAGLATLGEEEVDYLEYFARGWQRAGFDLPRDTLYRILDLEQRCWDEAARLAPDAIPTLEALRASGLRVGIASNAPFPPEMLHRQLRRLGLAERLDVAVFSSEVGRRKPAPELYHAALRRLGAAPNETLYVGDRWLEDYEGPRRLGMEAVLCTALAREPVPAGIPTIARLSELLTCLDDRRVG
ncbi:MAG TPA: HAD family hydrolase [Candidatus Dormibacteraeota bacterium]|nr:HAD family hydrolase [Candidatus Dormibacteraeota bacterium]